MFKWKSRFQKTLEKKTDPSFQAFFYAMSELLKPYSFTIDKASGDERIIAKDHYVYDFRLANKATDRAIVLTAISNARVRVHVRSSSSSFSLADFLKINFGIKEIPIEMYQSDSKYFRYQLEMFQKSLEEPEFKSVVEGRKWREWVCDMDWSHYK